MRKNKKLLGLPDLTRFIKPGSTQCIFTDETYFAFRCFYSPSALSFFWKNVGVARRGQDSRLLSFFWYLYYCAILRQTGCKIQQTLFTVVISVMCPEKLEDLKYDHGGNMFSNLRELI